MPCILRKHSGISISVHQEISKDCQHRWIFSPRIISQGIFPDRITRISPCIQLVDPHSVVPIRVSNISVNWTQGSALRTNISNCSWPKRYISQSIPKAVEVTTSSHIAIDIVVRIQQHKWSNRDVGLVHQWRFQAADSQIVPYHVVWLSSIMQEEVMTTNPIGNILLDCQKVDSVKGYSSCVGFVDGVAPSVWVLELSVHVEVYAVSAWDLGLTAKSELCVCHMGL